MCCQLKIDLNCYIKPFGGLKVILFYFSNHHKKTPIYAIGSLRWFHWIALILYSSYNKVWCYFLIIPKDNTFLTYLPDGFTFLSTYIYMVGDIWGVSKSSSKQIPHYNFCFLMCFHQDTDTLEETLLPVLEISEKE